MLAGDLLRYLGAGLSLLGLGFAMGFSPTLIGVTLHTLTTASKPNRSIMFMLVGLAIGSTALLFLLQFIDPRSFEALVRHDAEAVLVRRGVDLTVGLLFTIAAIIMWLRERKPKPPKPKKPPKEVPVEHPWRMILVGASNAVIGVSGVATMYMTARVIRDVSGDDLVRIIAYAIFMVAVIAPYVTLGWVWSRFPATASRIRLLLTRLLHINYRPWATALTLLAGLIFLGLGIWGHGR